MEEWKDVVGYEGFYQVSSEGRVRSLVRLLPAAVQAGIRKEKQILAFGSNKQGRLQVALSAYGKVRRFQVHTLVCTAFNGPCPEGLECRHEDGNCANNRPGNLSWGTHTDNMRDKRKHGTQTEGGDSPRAKLTEKQVLAIRKDKRTMRAIAKDYGVSMVAIVFIKNRKTWKHLP